MKTSRFIAKAYGLYGIFFALAILSGGGGMIERLIEAMGDPGFLFVSGFMTLLIGAATVAGHNVWDGSWRVVITVVGYLALLKGFMLLAWPSVLLEISKGIMESGAMPVQLVVAGVFYGWLAWMGFRPETGESRSLSEAH